MKTVADVLRLKQEQSIFTVGPDTMVLEGIAVMAEYGIGALMVLEGERLVGMFSERDYTRKIALMERSSRSTTVSEIMSTVLTTVTPAQSIEHCMEMMTERRIRHLPVMEGERVIGLVSIGDLVKAIITDQKQTIEHLEHYIRGE